MVLKVPTMIAMTVIAPKLLDVRYSTNNKGAPCCNGVVCPKVANDLTSWGYMYLILEGS